MTHVLVNVDADGLVDLPPSAKFVYAILRVNGECTQQELAEETLLPIRTVRDALTRLDDADNIPLESRPCYDDLRKDTYYLATEREG